MRWKEQLQEIKKADSHRNILNEVKRIIDNRFSEPKEDDRIETVRD